MIRIHNTKHVKGHQDQKKSNEELTLPERLNIQADALATTALKEILNKKQKTIAFPNCGAYLIKGDNIQSSKEFLTCVWRHAEFELQKYYMKIWKIKQELLYSINWSGIRLARNRCAQHIKVFNIKHCIGWIATGRKLQLYGYHVTKCPLCNEDETQEHLFTCKHRFNDNIILMKEFEVYLEKQATDRNIIQHLTTHMNDWMQQNKTICIKLENKLLHKCISEQTDIGWDKITCGIVHNGFALLQEQHYVRQGKATLGDKWSSNISHWWIQKSYERWKKRNEELHGKNSRMSKRDEEELFQRIRDLYKQIDKLPDYAKDNFGPPIEERIKQNINGLQDWIDITETTVNKLIQYNETQSLKHQSKITEYFENQTKKNQTNKILRTTQKNKNNTNKKKMTQTKLTQYYRKKKINKIKTNNNIIETENSKISNTMVTQKKAITKHPIKHPSLRAYYPCEEILPGL